MNQKAPQRLIKIIYILIFLLGVLTLWIIFRTKPVEIEKANIRHTEFTEKYLIDGKVRSKNKQTVVAFASGDIDEIKLKPGDSIHKGDLISILHWDFEKRILSPINGVVVKVYRQSSGPINRGDSIVDIIDPEDVEIVAEVLTSDAVHIHQDDSAQVSGIGDAIYDAKVTAISRGGFIKTSALGVEEERTEVRLILVDVPLELIEKIGDNYHVEIEITLSKTKDALTVPLGALFKDGEKWAVYIIEKHRAHLVHIEISKKNDREAIVENGLKEGQQVILFPSDLIREGVKVRD